MLSSLYTRSESSRPPLRIGLLLDSAELSSCFAEIVDHILQSNFARLELIVYNGEEQAKGSWPKPRRSLIGKALYLLKDSRRRKSFLFNLYQRWDRRNIDPANDPHTPVDCSARFAHVESISVIPNRKRFVHRFPQESIEYIREKQLDVLIRFGFNILRGDILKAAKYGVWSYHHGDGDFYRGGPAHFWEVYEGNPISGVMLQILTEELDAGNVLCKGLYTTHPGISRTRNCVQPYWGASTFVIQKLHELHQYGWEQLEHAILPSTPYLGKKKIYTAASNYEMLRWLLPLFAMKCLRRLVRRPSIEHWRLAIRSTRQLDVHSKSAPDMHGFQWIESPKGHFYADPFLIEDSGKNWVFFEDYDYAKQLGRICCAEVREEGMSNAIPVLETPYHLSYPCVFRDANTMYMIPETGTNSAVELYRCVRFPDQWELEKQLFLAQAVDTTIWIENNLYWFFVTLQEPRGYGTQLCLFYSSTLTGEWVAHPRNPISNDVRNSRGAGAIFRHNGKLFRPSQDCSQHYGYSMTFNEIVVLDRSDYEEKACTTINPTWSEGLTATHTYSRLGQLEVIDGCVPFPTRVIV
jgi:hypothetical protein